MRTRLTVSLLTLALSGAVVVPSASAWTNVYGPNGPDRFSSAEALAMLPDGSAIVAGCFDGEFNGLHAADGLDTFVMKLSPEGETLWTYTEDGSHYDDCQTFQIVVDDAENTFFSYGLHEKYIAGIDSGGAALPASFSGGLDPCAGAGLFPNLDQYRQLFAASDGFAFRGAEGGACTEGDGDFVGRFELARVLADGSVAWTWEPIYPAEYGIDDYLVRPVTGMSRADGVGGYLMVAKHMPELSYKQTDLAVYRIGADGTELWSTLINGSCVSDEDWSLVTEEHIILDSPLCEDSEVQAARVLSLATGAVVTDYDQAALRGDSMLRGQFPDPACYEYSADAPVWGDYRISPELVVFNYERCDSDLPEGYRECGSAVPVWEIRAEYQFRGFADLGDGRYAAPTTWVGDLNCSGGAVPHDEYRVISGYGIGVFEIVADGFLRPVKFVSIFDDTPADMWDPNPDPSTDSVREVAVSPTTGQVVAVGRSGGSSSVNLSASRSLSAQNLELPNALTVSVSSEAVPLTHGFDDVSTSGWKSDAVYWMRQSGVTTGCGDTTYCPDQEMTREQQITFLHRYAGEPSAGPQSPFTDVPRGTYYTTAIDWAYNNNITTGISSTRFGTGQPVTRAQAVTFLWRQAEEPEPDGAVPFDDVPADNYFTKAVAWAYEAGITTGKSPTVFAPYDAVTRVEFAAFLSRYDNLP
jgi:hypothetical protein